MSRSSLTEFALANPLYVWVIVLTCLIGVTYVGTLAATLGRDWADFWSIWARFGSFGRLKRHRLSRSRVARVAIRVSVAMRSEM